LAIKKRSFAQHRQRSSTLRQSAAACDEPMGKAAGQHAGDADRTPCAVSAPVVAQTKAAKQQ
jgi:hypothetical protein